MQILNTINHTVKQGLEQDFLFGCTEFKTAFMSFQGGYEGGTKKNRCNFHFADEGTEY